MSSNPNYAKYSDFGNNQISRDPLSYTMNETYDRKFLESSIGNYLGPRSRNGQEYMSQRCAENWDGMCSYYMFDNAFGNPITTRQYIQPNMVGGHSFNGQASNLSIGEQLLQNAFMKRFCSFKGPMELTDELVNPLDPSSPVVHIIKNKQDLIPVCNLIDPKTIDDDNLMNEALDNGELCKVGLINVCNNTQHMDLSGTRLGKFCQAYHEEKHNLRR